MRREKKKIALHLKLKIIVFPGKQTGFMFRHRVGIHIVVLAR